MSWKRAILTCESSEAKEYVKLACTFKEGTGYADHVPEEWWLSQDTKKAVEHLTQRTTALRDKLAKSAVDRVTKSLADLKTCSRGTPDGKSWKEGLKAGAPLTQAYQVARAGFLAPKAMGNLKKFVAETVQEPGAFEES